MKNTNIALYRKYRPKIFSEIIGQVNIVNNLINILKTNSLMHAYIFSGTRGTGKTTIAKIFAKALNCLNLQKNYDPCLKCENCLSINSDSLDIIELDAASHNGVDDIRNIIDNVMYLPRQLKKKVYIIDEAHMLSNAAWNALLKTLEEPPNHVVFIFATTEFNKIPITIVSRCQRYEFFKLVNNDLDQLIQNVCSNEKISIDSLAKQRLITLSDGAARDCLSLLEQLATYANNQITIESLNELFGLIDNKFMINFLIELLDKKIESIVNKLIVLEKNFDIKYLINQLINILLDVNIYKLTNSINLVQYLAESELKQFSAFNVNQINQLVQSLYTTLKDIKNKGSPLFYLKVNLFKYINDNQHSNYNNAPVVNNNVIVNNSQTIVNQNTTTTNTTKQAINNPIFITNQDLNNTIESKSVRKPLVKKPAAIPVETNQTYDIKKLADRDYYSLFKKIAPNSEKKKIAALNDKLKQLKEHKQKYDESITKIIQHIDKFYICSNNLAFILIDDSLLAKSFNKNFMSKKTRELIQKAFEDNQLYLIAASKDELIQYNKLIKSEPNTEFNKITIKEIQEFFDIKNDDDIIKKLNDFNLDDD